MLERKGCGELKSARDGPGWDGLVRGVYARTPACAEINVQAPSMASQDRGRRLGRLLSPGSFLVPYDLVTLARGAALLLAPVALLGSHWLVAKLVS